MTEKSPTPSPYAGWSIEALIAEEESLYDREVEGEDVWFDRDQILWELNARNFRREDTLTASKPVPNS